MAEEKTDPVCECGDTHEKDYYPEQCPKCEKWFVGQCASDNLIYTECEDSEPCSCLECEKHEEEPDHEEGQVEGGVGAERLHEEEKKAEENVSNIK